MLEFRCLLLSPAMRSNAGMANRQGDVDRRFAQESAHQLTLWLGSVRLGSARFGSARVGSARLGLAKLRVLEMYLVFIWDAQYSCLIWMKLEFCPQIWEKYSTVACNGNLSGRSRVIPTRMEGRMDGQRQTSGNYLTLAFRNSKVIG